MMARVVVLLLAIICAWAQAQGVVAVLTQNGLNYATQEGLAVLQQQLNGLTVTVPNQSGDQDTISWSISNIVISGFSIPDLQAAFASGQGISLTTSNIAATINANWYAREDVWPHPSGSGTATIAISSVSMDTEVTITENNGRLSVADSNTGVSIGNLNINFSGSGLDWLLNLLKSLFLGPIKNSAQTGIAQAINNVVNQNLENLLQSLPDTKAINNILSVDFTILSNPVITSSDLSVPIKGEFYLTSTNTYPKARAPLPTTTYTNEMLEVVVQDTVPNSAFFVYYKAGLITYTVTPSMVPPASPVQFNTSQWGDLVPPLAAKYPGWLMQVVASADDAPVMTITPTDVQLVFPASVEFEVLQPKTNKPIPAFTLEVNVTADVTVAVIGNNITGKITYFNATLALASSQIGAFDPSSLEQLILFGLDSVAAPQLNKYLIQGFPIPTFDGVTLVDPTVALGNTYITVSTDVQYSPPK